MYQYVTNKQYRNQLRETCESIIKNVQKSFLRNYFTFQFKLIGSGETKLITQNGENGEFDLDYNLILQKDKQDLISNPKRIKDLFIQAFNDANKGLGFKPANNSTSVITSKLVLNNKLHFSFDVAIICEGNNGNFYKLIYDKNTGRYLWNELKSSRNYEEKISILKQEHIWTQVKELYLNKKNMYLRRNEERNSFSIFLETINEICTKNGIIV